MRLSCAIILVILLSISSNIWCQMCSDSSFHLRYNVSERFDAQQQILLSDGGRVIGGDLQTSAPGLIITRFDKHNDILWSKKIIVDTPYLSVGLKSMEETLTNNIAICGFLRKSISQFDFYFALFNPVGNLIVQKVVKFPGITNFNDRYKESILICKKGIDSLLFMFSTDWNGSDPQKMCLITTDDNGVIGPTTIINLPPTSYALEFAKAKILSNRLYLCGSAYQNYSCSFLNNTGSFVMAEINLATNQVIQQKAFCLPTAGGSGFVGYSPYYGAANPADIYRWRQNVFF